MSETWRTSPTYPLLEVSNTGMVRRTISKELVKLQRNKHGYLEVMTKGSRVHKLVHRLVAEAFVNKNIDGKHVHHINGNKTDDNAGNLSVVSALKHAAMHGPRAAASITAFNEKKIEAERKREAREKKKDKAKKYVKPKGAVC